MSESTSPAEVDAAPLTPGSAAKQQAAREAVSTVAFVVGYVVILVLQRKLSDPDMSKTTAMRVHRARQLLAATAAEGLHLAADRASSVAASARSAYFEAAGQ